MKLLRIIPTMSPSYGGPSQGVRNSIAAMADKGIETEIISFDEPDADYVRNSAAKIHALGSPKTPWSYNKNLRPWLRAHVTNYDVVVIHGLWQYHSWGAMKEITAIRKKTGKGPALFLMAHGMLDPYFQKAKERRLKAIRNSIYWQLLEKKVVNSVDGLLFTSQVELELARQAFPGYKPAAELNVGYGVAPAPPEASAMKEEFLQQFPQLRGRDYLLYLSRIDQKKGVDLLVNAYTDLKKEHDLPPLVIAGPGLDKPYGQSLQAAAAGQPDILFPGMLQGALKFGAFHGCGAFILPSHQENFGIAVVEALSCSRPVLISDKVNIYEEIVQAKAGMAAADNLQGTRSLLLNWIRISPEQRTTMARNAKDCYLANYEPGNAAARLKQVFEQHLR